MEVIIEDVGIKHRFTNISRIDGHTDPKYTTLYDEKGQVLRKFGKGANIQVVEKPPPETQPEPEPVPIAPKPAARKRASKKKADKSK